ncbi:hypothetical protein [Exiguobacterium sp. s102]|uniref:hypothetical protein n=1 Tax=Exiguobacterium sp. s102 TaxID=2751212 RepID=UPI001BE554AA|nr:hypothetical protein [Exiguobacterium sp. s102]
MKQEMIMVERRPSAVQLIAMGYDKTEKERLQEGVLTNHDAKEEGDVTNFEGQKQKRKLTALDLLINGYTENEVQKTQEVAIDVNNLKASKE